MGRRVPWLVRMPCSAGGARAGCIRHIKWMFSSDLFVGVLAGWRWRAQLLCSCHSSQECSLAGCSMCCVLCVLIALSLISPVLSLGASHSSGFVTAVLIIFYLACFALGAGPVTVGACARDPCQGRCMCERALSRWVRAREIHARVGACAREPCHGGCA